MRASNLVFLNLRWWWSCCRISMKLILNTNSCSAHRSATRTAILRSCVSVARRSSSMCKQKLTASRQAGALFSAMASGWRAKARPMMMPLRVRESRWRRSLQPSGRVETTSAARIRVSGRRACGDVQLGLQHQPCDEENGLSCQQPPGSAAGGVG